MPNYRRLRVPGATVFITLVTYQRAPFLIQPHAREVLGNAWKYVSKKHPFTIDAVCLLPDHLHMLITLPDFDADYSIRIREIKRMFSNNFVSPCSESLKRDISHQNKKEAAFWQRRFWEHIIRDEIDYRNHFDYIHFNPVKHGYVENPASWEWSSFHRYLKAGVYQEDWNDALDQRDLQGNFGEW